MTNFELSQIINPICDIYSREAIATYEDGNYRICIPGIFWSDDYSTWRNFLRLFPNKLQFLTPEQENRRQVPEDLPDFKETWRTTDVLSLFEAWIKGNYSVCPILADAMQDAGCDYDVLLTELRQIPIYGGWIIPYFKVCNFALMCKDWSFFKEEHLSDCNSILAMNKCDSIKCFTTAIAKQSKLNLNHITACLFNFQRLTYASFAMYQHGLLDFSKAVVCSALAQIALTRRN